MRIRLGTVQRAAEIVMVLGIVALCQPWSMVLHRYGLTVIIAGLLAFMVTGWMGAGQIVENLEEPVPGTPADGQHT